MTNIIEKFDFTNLEQMVVWIGLAYGIVFVAMAVDLVSGVQKAIRAHVARTSEAYKRTCDKANKYYSPMLRLTFIDILISAFFYIPVFTMMWGAWCVFCEWKSVTEKTHTKQELRKAAKTMNVILENKEDVAKIVAEVLMDMSEEKRERRQKEVE